MISRRHFLKIVKEIPAATWALFFVYVLLFGAAGAGGWYVYNASARSLMLEGEIRTLSNSLASTTALLQASIADTHSALSIALANEQKAISNVQNQLGSVQGQVGSLGSSVTTLTKLTTTDPQFLAKYSKVYFLNENYQPARLVSIPNQYKYFENREMQLIPEILPTVEKMIDDAKKSGVTLYVYSAYRSFKSQEILKGGYIVAYGAGTANQFSADQGYSEHQLGTTVDFMTTGINGELSNIFATTPAYAWLEANAYKYGFELSYPKDNSDYIYEPWHWRFVGVTLATYLENNHKYFYSLDQRTIDRYLAELFDNLPSQ